MSARVRFAVFVALVLALPGGLMAVDDAQVRDLGKLAMILSPAVAGFLLSRGLPGAATPRRWRWVARAAAITLAVAGLALAVAFITGVAAFRQASLDGSGVAMAVGASALTSLLEEAGWAAGGLTLAVAAYGRQAGVTILGLVWAAWHLIPALLKVGLFPDLEAAPPAMLAAFVVACLVYRELLTVLREQAGTWWAAGVAHAAPNMLLAGVMAGGVGAFDLSAGWWWFPAPGGVVFLIAALGALIAVRQAARAS